MRLVLTALTAITMFSTIASAEEDGAGDAFCDSGQLERAFGIEEMNTSWRETAETVLFSHIAQAPALALTDLDVQCRETVCRLRFTFPTREYQRDFGNTLVADALNAAPGFMRDFGQIVPGTDGLPTMTYYLKRSGACISRPVK